MNREIKNNFKCPVCKGSGKIFIPRSRQIDEKCFKKMAAKTLLENGYSIRQVQKLLDYGSTRSVHLIKKKLKI